MRHVLIACSIAALVASASELPAQTYEELKQENEALRARIKALEAEGDGASAEILRYDPATGNLLVKVGDKERTIPLMPRTHVHDPEGYEVRGAERVEKLKPGVRIEIVEEAGKLAEINILDGRRAGHKHDHKHDHAHGHNGDHKYGHGDHGHYDYFRPAHSHGRKVGLLSHIPIFNRGTNGHHEADAAAANAHETKHGGADHGCEARIVTSFWDHRSWHRKNGHKNGNGHHGNGHGSVEGYPFLHFNKLEPAYVDRALEINFAYARNADGGLFHEAELEFELLWAVNDRVELVIAGPLRWLNATGRPEIGDGEVSFPRSAGGFGDLELALNFLAFNGERMKFKTGLAVTVPTGSEGRGLGEGHAIIEPGTFLLFDLGHGTVVQAQAAFEMPIDVPEAENEFRYGVGLGHTFVGTGHWRFFRWLTPCIEGTGVTVMNGPESGLTVFDLTPGLRWFSREHDEAGFGISFPVTGRRDFDYQVIFRYLLHF